MAYGLIFAFFPSPVRFLIAYAACDLCFFFKTLIFLLKISVDRNGQNLIVKRRKQKYQQFVLHTSLILLSASTCLQ